MKILHTSDWHIGKKLNGRSRLDEQRAFFIELVQICDSENIELVLVAGDVFDTFIPAAEAEEVFFNAVDSLASPSRAVVIISGNHDDWQRLSAARAIAGKANVYVFGGEKAPYYGGNYSVNATFADKNCCIISNGKESVFIGALPYPNEQRLGEKRDSRPFNEKVGEWISDCFAANENNFPQILVSHLFMTGGEKTDGEREIELAGARAVDKTAIPENCIYTAIGHLHKRQVVSKSRNIIYSGSPIAYSFDEIGYEKSVTVFETDESEVKNIKTVAVKSGKQLARFVASSLEEGKQYLTDNAEKLVSLKLILDAPLSERETKVLMTEYPALVDLQLETVREGKDFISLDRRKLSDREAFAEYYKSRYGAEAPDEIMQAYLKLIEE